MRHGRLRASKKRVAIAASFSAGALRNREEPAVDDALARERYPVRGRARKTCAKVGVLRERDGEGALAHAFDKVADRRWRDIRQVARRIDQALVLGPRPQRPQQVFASRIRSPSTKRSIVEPQLGAHLLSTDDGDLAHSRGAKRADHPLQHRRAAHRRQRFHGGARRLGEGAVDSASRRNDRLHAREASDALLLGESLLLAGDGALGTFARARVRLRSLAAHRKSAPMAHVRDSSRYP